MDPRRVSFPQEIRGFFPLCSHCPFCRWVERAIARGQTQQTWNISLYKLSVATGDTGMDKTSQCVEMLLPLSASLPPHFPSVICGLMLNLLQRKEPKAKIPAGAAGPSQTWAENSIGKVTGLERRFLKTQTSGLIPFMAAKTEITSLLKPFSLYCVNITLSRTE